MSEKASEYLSTAKQKRREKDKLGAAHWHEKAAREVATVNKRKAGK